jgi:hypothetical protein
MRQIVTASDQTNAAIIRGFLESRGIRASFGPAGSVGLTMGTGAAGQDQHVFVEEKDADEALRLLKEQGLINHQ